MSPSAYWNFHKDFLQSDSHIHIQLYLHECLNRTWNTVASTVSSHSNNKIVSQQRKLLNNWGKTTTGEKREAMDLNGMKNKREHQIYYIQRENIFCLFFMQNFLTNPDVKGSVGSREFIWLSNWWPLFIESEAFMSIYFLWCRMGSLGSSEFLRQPH